WKCALLDCRGKRSATPLGMALAMTWVDLKRRRRCALPAQSKNWPSKEDCLQNTSPHSGTHSTPPNLPCCSTPFARVGVRQSQTTLLLRDVRDVSRELSARRERTLSATAKYLAAAAQVEAGKTNVAQLARRHGVDEGALAAWLEYLGVGSSGPVKVEGHFTATF